MTKLHDKEIVFRWWKYNFIKKTSWFLDPKNGWNMFIFCYSIMSFSHHMIWLNFISFRLQTKCHDVFWNDNQGNITCPALWSFLAPVTLAQTFIWFLKRKCPSNANTKASFVSMSCFYGISIKQWAFFLICSIRNLVYTPPPEIKQLVTSDSVIALPIWKPMCLV